MKLTITILTLIFFTLFSCTSTKTTKVYIEVGVNDYTKTVADSNTKTKKLDGGFKPNHSSENSKLVHHSRKPH